MDREQPSVGRSARAFLKLAVEPIPQVWALFALILGVGLWGFVLWLVAQSALIVAFGVLGVFSVLFFIAGARLMKRELDRSQEKIVLRPHIEWLQGRALQLGGSVYEEPTYLWVTVHNCGPYAEFESWVKNVEGYGDGTDNYAPHIAWENTSEDTQPIARGAEQRIMLGCLAKGNHVPRFFWFWIPKSAAWAKDGHGASPPLPSDGVTCVLEVHDRTHDTIYAYEVFAQHGEEPLFTVTRRESVTA